MRLHVPGLDAILGWIWAIGTAVGFGTVAAVAVDGLDEPAVAASVPDADVSGWQA
ncbi:hypothetical protein ACIGO8_33290 [Streptomyces sp. NPDC053493]|uniref:hypothetical protein n=1 Tax=Streptomyces sp. NPDC053493 TaxID=3365705 RepID=UPI0037D6AC38